MTDGRGLRARDVSARRGSRRALSEVSLELAGGAITGVLGPNGAGKSTLLMVLAGLIAPERGAVELDGQPLARWSRSERARRVSYVPQQTGLSAPLPVREVVSQGRFSHRGALGRLGPDDERAVARAMERTDVETLSPRSFDALSGGEQRRVLLARALATEARTILLDEPTASLDVGHALALYALLRELADDGYAIAVVLHQLDDARRRTDRALMLDGGAPVACGPSREVVSAERVRQTYGVALIEGGAVGFELPEEVR